MNNARNQPTGQIRAPGSGRRKPTPNEMKSIIKMFRRKTVRCLFILVLAVFSSEIASAQGTITYVSNLGQPSSGSASVGSNSWFAAGFITGTNVAGYVLNSVQLAVTDASGNPSGFTVMIYNEGNSLGGIIPGVSLGTLAGPANPATAGTYSYTPSVSLTLSPNIDYFIVLTSGTSVANGAYGWSVTSIPTPGYNSYHWGGGTSFLDSSDGVHWSFTSANYGQFAIYATPAPEPGVLGLFALGGLLVAFQRRKTRPVQ
jgi:hypothetical protein